MKSLLSVIAFLATASPALSLSHPDQAVLRGRPRGGDQYLVELGPGESRWITEDEKWILKRV
jgi:hypothetical protein